MSSPPMEQMKGPWKIAFEEHFLLRGVETKLPGRAGIIPDIAEKRRKILEVGEERIAAMDRAGIEFTILSLNAPGIQGEFEPVHAVRLAKRVNDELAAIVSQHPKRFGGFAAIPLQDPKAAADELERAVRQLGFKGALVNGYSNIGDENTAEYLDEPKFYPFWERAQDSRRTDLSAPSRSTSHAAAHLSRTPGTPGGDVGIWRRNRNSCAKADYKRTI